MTIVYLYYYYRYFTDCEVLNDHFKSLIKLRERVIKLGINKFYQSNFEKNGKWDITSMSTSTETNNGKTILNYRLNLQRKSSFYILFLIVPAILLSILNAFVFVLPEVSGEKVGYTMAVFLSYTLFYTTLPKTPCQPLLRIYSS